MDITSLETTIVLIVYHRTNFLLLCSLFFLNNSHSLAYAPHKTPTKSLVVVISLGQVQQLIHWVTLYNSPDNIHTQL